MLRLGESEAGQAPVRQDCSIAAQVGCSVLSRASPRSRPVALGCCQNEPLIDRKHRPEASFLPGGIQVAEQAIERLLLALQRLQFTVQLQVSVH